MSKETGAADAWSQEGSPEADRHLAENFGLTTNLIGEVVR